MNKMRIRAALVLLLVCAPLAEAAPARVLFPANLHLTREISDPLAGTVITVEEYCSGNRMVSVAGDRTVIADYDKEEITEIDRRAGTYSVSRFEEIAGTARGKATMAGKAEVKVDRTVSLSREALEAIIGAAYPNASGPEHEEIFRAAASLSLNETVPVYGLPVAQTIAYEEAGSVITVRSRITRIGSETVPPEALVISPAAKRIESPAVSARRDLFR